MLLVIGLIGLTLVMALCAVASKNAVVIGLVVARSLCDYGVVYESRPSILGAISVGVTLVAIYTVSLHGLSGTVLSRSVRIVYGPLLLILIWSAIAYAHFGIRSSLYSDSLRVISIAAIFCLAASVRPNKRNVYRLVLAIGLPAVLVSLVSAVGFIPYGSIGIGRLAGTFSHPNAAGAFFGLLTSLLVIFWLNDRGKLVAAAATLSGLALVLTGSLGSIAGCLVAILVGIFVVNQVSRQAKVLVTLAIGALGFLAYGSLGLAQRFEEFDLGGRAASSGQSPDSLEWRVENWRRLLDIWQDSPIFGFGLGSTSNIINPLGGPPHSFYIQTVVEFGVVGSLVVLLIVARWSYSSVRMARSNYWQGSASLAMLTFFMVNGLVSNTTGYTAMMCLFAACAGYLFSSSESANSNDGIARGAEPNAPHITKGVLQKC